MNDNVNQLESTLEKYPTDKNYHCYYSTKYLDRIQNTDHCYSKNMVKGVILLPIDATLVGVNIVGVIAMNLCYIFG